MRSSSLLAILPFLLLLPALAGAADRPVEPAGPVRTWRWLDAAGSGAGARRVALLVGVGRHARHPSWDLPWVRRDLDELERVLSEKAAFHVVRIEDAEVSVDSIRTAIDRRVAPLLGGSGNLVLVCYSGHGYLDERGECRYFLPHTDPAGAGYAPTLGEGELGRLLAGLRRGGKAKVVLVADACRVPVAAPGPRRRPRRLEVADATIHSTRRGEFARATEGQRRSVFSESLTARLEALSSAPALELGTLFDAVSRDLREAGAAQSPELTPDREDVRALRLLDRANLTLGVRVVHGLSGRELTGAGIRVAGLGRGEESPALIEGLAPGRYRIEVESPGMFREVVEVAIGARDSGRTIEVALRPSYALLGGRVEDEGGKPVTGAICRLIGSRSGFLPEYHTFEASTDPDGLYWFRVPTGARVNAVSISAGVGGKRELPLDLERMAPEEAVRGAHLERTYDLGKVIVPSGAVVTVKELGLSGRAAVDWRAGERFATEGRSEDLEIAIRYYGRALASADPAAKAKGIPRVRWCYAQLLEHLRSRGEYARGAELAGSALEEFPGDERFTELRARCRREAIPADLRSQLAAAARAVDRGDFHAAETAYRAATEREAELTPHYRAEVKSRLEGVMDKLYLDAVTGLDGAWLSGDLDRAAESFEELRRIDPEHPVLDLYARRLRERLDAEPPEVALLGADGRPLGAGPVTTHEGSIRIRVAASDNRGLRSLRVRGEEQRLEAGAKEAEIPFDVGLEVGETRVEVEATDLAGRTARTEARIVRRERPKAPPGFTPLGKNAQGYEELRHEVTGIVFVKLPGGTFRMGGTTEEEREVRDSVPAKDREKVKGWLADEKPRHEVTLSPFLIAKHEVTQAQWRKVMGTSPSHFKGDDLPVEQVSWEECQEFCRKAGLRLPTEAQWEYACRAGTDTPIYGGALEILGLNNAPALDPIAWYGGNSGVERDDGVDSSGWSEKQYAHRKAGTHPVGTKRPNGYGLHDMIGNVYEWCEDVYDAEFYGKAAASGRDPVCTTGSEYRVFRGGSWSSHAGHCRSAYRFWHSPGVRYPGLGLRPSSPSSP